MICSGTCILPKGWISMFVWNCSPGPCPKTMSFQKKYTLSEGRCVTNQVSQANIGPTCVMPPHLKSETKILSVKRWINLAKIQFPPNFICTKFWWSPVPKEAPKNNDVWLDTAQWPLWEADLCENCSTPRWWPFDTACQASRNLSRVSACHRLNRSVWSHLYLEPSHLPLFGARPSGKFSKLFGFRHSFGWPLRSLYKWSFCNAYK